MMLLINPLNEINENLIKGKESIPRQTGSETFQYALTAAQDIIEANQVAQKEVEQKTIDFMTGTNDNIVDLMVAQEKSSILLQYSLQMRNSILSAYKEIINLSI